MANVFAISCLVAMTLALTLTGCGDPGEAEPPGTTAAIAGGDPAGRVAERAEDVKPMSEGAHAPVGTLLDADGAEVDLEQTYAEGPTLLVFFRGGWCPYCSEHLADLIDLDPEMREMGIQIVAVSPDKPDLLSDKADEMGLNYRLLSDSPMTVAQAFGLAFRVDDETIEQYDDYGIDLEESSGQSHHLLPVPAVYLIDREGVIHFAHWNPDYKQRVDPADLMAAATRVTSE
ncbi:MAG: peroxiredoxin-like family protein [Phycisphaeraceae bacterium]